jgi:hypothetical protein
LDLWAFELVILRRPPDAPAYDEVTLDRIQREHLEFHAPLREKGIVVTNGPVIDQHDESFRGSRSIERVPWTRRVGSPIRTRRSRPADWRSRS